MGNSGMSIHLSKLLRKCPQRKDFGVVTEVRNDLVDGIGINCKLFAERMDGGEGFSRPDLTRNDSSLYGIDHLFVKRNA
jgi:hypothetical protein